MLCGLAVLATCACSPSVSPTTQVAANPAPVAIKADERKAALEVIDRAIQAHGGKEALAKIHAIIRDASGSRFVGKVTPIADHTTIVLPDRVNMQSQIGDTKFQFVINGDKGWSVEDKLKKTMNAPDIETMKQDLYLIWLLTLMPLQTDEVEVGSVADETVENRPVSVVRVRSKGKAGLYPDVFLSFDKESGLLVREKMPDFNDAEHILSNHKEFEGVKMPTREVWRAHGQLVLDVTFSSWKFPATVSEVEFNEP
jgi:hypothetical protein